MGSSDIEIDYQHSLVERHPEPVGEVEINGKKFKLDASLHGELHEKIKEILSRNMDAFAWLAVDMSRSILISCVII